MLLFGTFGGFFFFAIWGNEKTIGFIGGKYANSFNIVYAGADAGQLDVCMARDEATVEYTYQFPRSFDNFIFSSPFSQVGTLSIFFDVSNEGNWAKERKNDSLAKGRVKKKENFWATNVDDLFEGGRKWIRAYELNASIEYNSQWIDEWMYRSWNRF